jgi:hypothetical protein
MPVTTRRAIFKKPIRGMAIFISLVLLSLRAAHAAPAITGVTTFNITGTDAFIQWTTNVAADEQVDWGPTASYGNTTTLPAYPAAAFTNHVVHLSLLTAGIQYHFRVKSNDGTGLTTSGDFTFTTPSGSGTGHVQGGLLKDDNSNGAFDAGEKYFRDPAAAACPNNDFAQLGLSITFIGSVNPITTMISSCDPNTGRPIYSIDLPVGQYTAQISKPIFPGWTVTSADNVPITVTNGGNLILNFAMHMPATDTTPPVISGVFATPVGATTASIQWTTDEEADGEVDYGPTTAYGSVALQPLLAVGRRIDLTGLTPSTLYHFRLKSKDASGNLATSGDFNFTTTSVTVCTPPVSCFPMFPGCSFPNATTCDCGIMVCPTPANPPAIMADPQDQTVLTQSSPTFSVLALGDAPLTYLWQTKAPAAQNFVNVANSNNSAFTMNNVQLSQSETQIRCVVTNGTGTVTSNAATLTVIGSATAPSITQQPVSQSVTAGQVATFTVGATGSAPLTYVWQTALPGGSFSDWPFAGTNTFSITGDASLNGYRIRAVVSNVAGSTTSNVATLTVAAAPPLTANAGPDKTISMPAGAVLQGSMVGNVFPFIMTTWSKVSGPGVVTFTDPNLLVTTATFSQPGTYVVQLMVAETPPGTQSSMDTAQITVLSSPCDLSGDTLTNVADVQIAVNQAILTSPCTTADINRDSRCNIVDVQRIMNAALGGACVSP